MTDRELSSSIWTVTPRSLPRRRPPGDTAPERDSLPPHPGRTAQASHGLRALVSVHLTAAPGLAGRPDSAGARSPPCSRPSMPSPRETNGPNFSPYPRKGLSAASSSTASSTAAAASATPRHPHRVLRLRLHLRGGRPTPHPQRAPWPTVWNASTNSPAPTPPTTTCSSPRSSAPGWWTGQPKGYATGPRPGSRGPDGAYADSQAAKTLVSPQFDGESELHLQGNLLMAVLLSTEACGVVMGAWPGVRVRGAVLGPLALVNR